MASVHARGCPAETNIHTLHVSCLLLHGHEGDHEHEADGVRVVWRPSAGERIAAVEAGDVAAIRAWVEDEEVCLSTLCRTAFRHLLTKLEDGDKSLRAASWDVGKAAGLAEAVRICKMVAGAGWNPLLAAGATEGVGECVKRIEALGLQHMKQVIDALPPRPMPVISRLAERALDLAFILGAVVRVASTATGGRVITGAPITTALVAEVLREQSWPRPDDKMVDLAKTILQRLGP